MKGGEAQTNKNLVMYGKRPYYVYIEEEK